MPEGLQAARLSQRPDLSPRLQALCDKIAACGRDQRALNYSRKRFLVESQIEVSLLILRDEILSFASLQEGPQFPKGFARAMSRSWKAPAIRSLYPKKLMLILLGLQIQAALERQSISHIFTTAEGERRLWWKRWIEEAGRLHPGWRLHPQMAKVCNGPISLCCQSLVCLRLRGEELKELPFAFMPISQWRQHQ